MISVGAALESVASGFELFPQFFLRLPSETNRVVQVKYTNPSRSDPGHVLHLLRGSDRHRKRGFQDEEREKYAFDQKAQRRTNQLGVTDFRPACRKAVGQQRSLSLSGSNQAREGRLVNALAVRGDERRDTLR